jgi:hypothetical protein
MKKLLAAALITGTVLAATAPRAHAGASTDAALGLGAFAVFNQLFRGETVLSGLFLGRPAAVVVPPPPVVIYAPLPPPAVPPAVYVAPPPAVYYGGITPGYGKVKYLHKHYRKPPHWYPKHGWR